MPPKIKITKKDIINAAVDIVRADSADALCARTLAARLGCSTQPIFSNFSSMDEVFYSVVSAADELCNRYISREIESSEYPEYKASGIAYIRFAKEEKELFKLLYMRNRDGEAFPEKDDTNDQMLAIVNSNTGLSGNVAELFHLEMWAFVHGIASMFATGFLDLEWPVVSRMLSDCYSGLKKQYNLE